MAPSQKRKTIGDDFIFTISDNEDIVEESTLTAPPPPKKKAKTNNKKGKKGAAAAPVEDDEDEDDDDAQELNTGIWGEKEEDDGAMDSDFEFVADNTNAFDPSEFEGWGFEGPKTGVTGATKRLVDIDDIIRRRREKKAAKTKPADAAAAAAKKEEEEEEEEEAAAADEDEDAEEIDFEMDDEDDEVLAEDAFGMGVDSDVEESGDEKKRKAKKGSDDEDDDEEEEDDEDDEEGEFDDEDDDAASDNDSVATPVQHPDDMEGGGSDSDEDEEEDAEEAARRKDFFAPEEEEKPGKKSDVGSFQGMSLSRPILRGLGSVGFTKPTPIQAKTIPIALMGKDVVGGAVTGSGKTAAFIVPILERLLYRPKKVPTTRVIILMPTRELAIQCHSVAVKIASHTDIKFCLAVGGLSLKVQEAELRLRPDVVIATPGRFIDHMRNSASFTIETVEILVLDEADRMLEDGFADELNEILTTIPKSRQTMLFSATMTSSVDNLIRVGLTKPVRIMIDSKKKTVTTLTQEFVRLRPGREDKRMGYLVHICKTLYTERCIIFFRQKKTAHEVRVIFGLLGLSCAELHGSMNQAQRINSVEVFRDGKVSFLLATDLASRGLDIKGIDTVINYEAPQSLDTYVHRVGRTARAGRSGVAITLAAEPDRKVVKAAVRMGKAQGARISSRVIEASIADKWQEEIDAMEDEIEEIMKEEKEEKHLAQIEMQVKKGENLIRHEEEIHARPRRTWFETEDAKKAAREAGRAELNGVREKLKNKGEKGKLSNKDKKILDSKAEMRDGRSWKKGRAERDGKGVLLKTTKAKPDRERSTKPRPKAKPGKKAYRGKTRRDN
ncbi:P-loop containing nucleoside triphosphate hydrolase protein [Bombardia bombarda]|uniref:RNA helicase n=1 Tax=Bombardia bombarda TaxID=252184 RepID=A0AA40C9W2_9PEZI|nr:P-loop containing nucleoside triphosphate hydrolase protein [Bombardia bombarda]